MSSPIVHGVALCPLLRFAKGAKLRLKVVMDTDFPLADRAILFAARTGHAAALYKVTRAGTAAAWTTSSPNTIELTLDPAAANETEGSELTLADLQAQGSMLWRMDFLDTDSGPALRLQGDIEWLQEEGAWPDEPASTAAIPSLTVSIVAGVATVSVSLISDGGATVDNAAVNAAIAEDAAATQAALGLGSAALENVEAFEAAGAVSALAETLGSAASQNVEAFATAQQGAKADAATADMAAGALKGRPTGGATGSPVDLTPAQIKTLVEAALASGGAILLRATGTNNNVIAEPNGFGAFQVKAPSGTGMAAYNLMEFVDATGARIGMIYNEPTSGKMVFMNSRSGALAFGNAGADRFVVYTSGGVFIGNAAVDPGANSLQVQGNIIQSGSFQTGLQLNSLGGNVFFGGLNGGAMLAAEGSLVFRVGTGGSFPNLHRIQGTNGGPATSHGFNWDNSSLSIVSNGAGVLEQRFGTTAQKFRVFGTTTGSKYAQLEHDGTNAILSTTAGRMQINGLALQPMTVGTLPTASSNAGARYEVVDALSPVVGSAVSAGGGAGAVVRSNGTNWIVREVL